jgi:BA14K-like protein
MPFVVYVAIVISAVCGVALEWDALVEPSASTRQAMNAVTHMGAPPPSPLAKKEAAVPAVHAVNPATPAADNRAPVAQATANAPEANANPTASNTPGAANNAAAAIIAAEPPPPKCDVEACANAYISFRASDCSWQPYEGPRRLCTKGTETPADAAAADAHAEANSPTFSRCNRRACAEAYSSFNPSDCTYQPLDGPRRLCTK